MRRASALLPVSSSMSMDLPAEETVHLRLASTSSRQKGKGEWERENISFQWIVIEAGEGYIDVTVPLIPTICGDLSVN